MLTLPAPTPIVGDLLETALADAGLPTPVVLVGDTVELADLDETHRDAAEPIVAAHPVVAQAALDAAATERTNETTIRDRATQALAANAAFLALPAPTNVQNAAQLKALTRQNTALIRLLLRRFDGTD